MRRVPENRFKSGNLFFVTMATLGRLPRFTEPAAAEVLVGSLQYFRERKELELYAYTIMPEHIHALLRPLPPLLLSAWIRRFKTYTTFALGREPLWQTGCWTKVIDSHDMLLQKLSYIHSNPVRRELCEDPTTYRWSSAREYSENCFRLVTAYWDSVWDPDRNGTDAAGQSPLPR